MVQQDKVVVDWAARLRAALAPQPEAPPEPVAEPIAEAAGEAAGPARGAAEDTAPVAAEGLPAADVGPLGALLSEAPPAPALPPFLLIPAAAPPEPVAAPPPEPVAAPPRGLLSFLAPNALAKPATPDATSPLLSALVGHEAGPVDPPPAPTPQTILSNQPVLKAPPTPTRPPAAASPIAEPTVTQPPAAALPAAKTPVAKPAAPEPPEAAPADNPLGVAQVGAAYKAVFGAAMPAEAAGEGAEWVGLARSLEEARGSWRALFLGSQQPRLALAGALACGRRGLIPVLHATESDPARFGRLLTAMQAKGLDCDESRLLQAAVSCDPDKLPPRGALAQDLLEREESWDYLRVGAARLLSGMVSAALPALNARVRWLMLAPLNRMEEGAAIRALSGTWRLVAERPAALQLRNPRAAERPGVQLWRGPLA